MTTKYVYTLAWENEFGVTQRIGGEHSLEDMESALKFTTKRPDSLRIERRLVGKWESLPTEYEIEIWKRDLVIHRHKEES